MFIIKSTERLGKILRANKIWFTVDDDKNYILCGGLTTVKQLEELQGVFNARFKQVDNTFKFEMYVLTPYKKWLSNIDKILIDKVGVDSDILHYKKWYEFYKRQYSEREAVKACFEELGA